MKKVFAILLSLCMVLPLFAVLPVFAATPTEGYTFGADKWYYANGTLADAPRTVEAWIYVDPDGVDTIKSNGNACTIISNYNGFGNYAYWHLAVKYDATNGLYPYFEWNELLNNSTSVRKFNFTKTTITPGEWTHITVVIDAENNCCHAYKNGEYVQSNNAGIWLGDITKNVTELPLVIGNDNRFNTPDLRVFRGSIASISLYNDVRTAEEIASDYANGADYTDEHALAHWELTSDGAPVADKSGNGIGLALSQYWLTEEEMAAIRGDNFNPAYSFAVVGDIQYITEHDAAYGTTHVADMHKWIADNITTKNIKYMMGMGDVTNRNTAAEWQVAYDAITQLNGLLPYSVIQGNHDLYEGTSSLTDRVPNATMLGPTAIDGYFGLDETYKGQFSGETGGLYESDSVRNTYYKFTVGATNWLIVNLDFAPSDDVLKWANRVVAAHPDHQVIVTTHGYLHMDGTPISDEDSGSLWGDTKNNGEEMWTKFVSLHENIVMVLSGHMESNNIKMTQAKGVNGNTVTQFLIDQQAVDNPYMGTSWSTKEVTEGEATISYWYFNGVNTGVVAKDAEGNSYAHPTATVKDGYWYINDEKFVDMKYEGMPLGLIAMFYFDQDGKNVSVEWYSPLRDKYYQTCNQISFDMTADCEEQEFGWNGLSIAPKGSGTESDPYIVETAGNLLWMANQIKQVDLTAGETSTFANTYFKQVCDIDLAGLNIKSIGYYHSSEGGIERVAAFAGYYDGGGYSIKNGRVIDANSGHGININWPVGLFGCIWGATIENVTLENMTIWSRGLTGGIVGRAVAPRNVDAPSDFNVISNCHVTESCRIVSVWQNGKTLDANEYGYNTRYRAGVVGPICGMAYATTITGCTSAVEFSVDGEHSMAGGIAGMAGYNTVIENCAFTGGITLTDMNTTVSPTFGGIVGLLAPNYETETMNYADDYLGTLTIRNCYNSGSFTYTGTDAIPEGLEVHWGGILGHAKMLEKVTADKCYLIENCYNLYAKEIEDVLADDADYWIGGIVGKADVGNYDYYDSLTVKDCASVTLAVNGGDAESSTNEYRTTGKVSAYNLPAVLAENVTTATVDEINGKLEAIRLEQLIKDNAQNGTKWYYGEGTPAIEANVGDMYLDMTTGDVYQLALEWALIGNIRGPQGEQGIQGEKGEQGEQGIQGEKGEQGEQGIQGEKGETGAAGPQGPQGEQGEQGETGAAGADGNKWYTGATDPETVAGSIAGDLYLNTESGDVFRLDGTTWTKIGNLQGPQGEQGDQGVQGEAGEAPVIEIIDGYWHIDGESTGVKAEGVDGEDGAAGTIGGQLTIGDNGNWFIDGVDTGVQAQGPKGDKGDKGDTGATGPQGPQGEQGETGETGPQGPQGDKGDKGDKGDTGATGPRGPQGEDGADAVAPQIRINATTKMWEISTDNGVTWNTTGIKAEGVDGEDGADAVAPTVEIVDGYWYINGVNTNVKAEGIDGEDGQDGATGPAGPQGEKGDKGDKGDTGASAGSIDQSNNSNAAGNNTTVVTEESGGAAGVVALVISIVLLVGNGVFFVFYFLGKKKKA